ncbi:MAG TPA: glycoside hydrolase family 16 protein [Candidatus Acidoferrales bacterium]|nr:glycoside hydrolase family 16 protein [Candidatus Acidoferrales bacterium]
MKFVPRSNSIALMGMGGVLGIVCLLTMDCRSRHAEAPPSIEFTRLPPAGEGSPDLVDSIAGRVTGARPGQRIVLFARSGVWWVQPLAGEPFTTIQQDSTWKNSTHPGTSYAALLVDAGYKPPLTVNSLPLKGGPVQAVATAEGPMLDHASLKTLDFSGYEWVIHQTPANPAGTRNLYDAANAWVDPKGFLHLRIAQTSAGWRSAEIDLFRSLGYGSYRFVVSDVSHLEPPVVLTISAWDGSGPYREMDIEVSRWGELTGKNTQYVVQPYFVAANVVRFLSPPGRLTYSFDWEPGRVAFRTVRGSQSAGKPDVVAAHVFTSGVPEPGGESVHMNLYVFDNRRVRLQHGAEVIIEKFEYLP